MKKISAPPKKVLVAVEIAAWLGLSVRTARRRIEVWKQQQRLQALPRKGRHASQLYKATDIKRCYLEDQGLDIRPAVALDAEHLRQLVDIFPLSRAHKLSEVPDFLVAAASELAEAFDHAVIVALAYEELLGELSELAEATERGERSVEDSWSQLTKTLDRIHLRAAEHEHDDPCFSASAALRYARIAGFLLNEKIDRKP